MRAKAISNTILLFATVALVSGCSTSATPSKPKEVSSKPITVVSVSSQNVPYQQAVNPTSAAEWAITWKLSNGQTVNAHAIKSLKSIISLGNVAITSLQAPGKEITYYIVYLVKKNNLWTVAGVMGAPLNQQKKTNGLAAPFSDWNIGSITLTNIGIFNEIFTKNKFVSIVTMKSENFDYPKGEIVRLSSGRLVTEFQEPSIAGFYYQNGLNVNLIAGNVDNGDLKQLATGVINVPGF